jgi:hypothetical protein
MEEEMMYSAPLDENGKPYWVPVVVKNKEYLYGFLDSMVYSTQLADLDYNVLLFTLSSDRFNDVLPTGERMSSMTDERFKEHVKGLLIHDAEHEILKKDNAEFSEDILGDYYLPLNCTCGNFHGFLTPYDLPDEQFKCDLCGKVLIEYTNMNDEDFLYDGEYRDIQSVLDDVKDDLENGSEE